MEYVYLARTGVRVSELCLGTMTFGNEADESAARAIMDRAVEAGVNFFDTANIYCKGLTEEILGRWMGSRRQQLVLASKVHFPVGDGVNDRGSSRRHIMLAVEQSLKRLRTGWLDVLYLHHWDQNAAVEESLCAMDDLMRQGKVVYCAVSNFSAWQTVKAQMTAERRGLAPVIAVQPMYNLVKRQAEVEILPMAQAMGLAVCPYNPLAAGLLTGKYLKGEKGRLDENDMYRRRYQDPEYMRVAERFVAYARERGFAPAPLAVAWVLRHPAVTSTIVGVRNLEQLEDTLPAVDIAMTQEMRDEIGALSPEPPLATDRERQ